MKSPRPIVAILIAATACLAAAGPVEDLVTFNSNTPARAAEVNANFAAVKTAVDYNYADFLDHEAASGIEFHGGGGREAQVVVTETADWTTGSEFDFNDLTIEETGRVIVSAGTIIRCLGTFTNRGILEVLPATRSTGVVNFSAGSAGMYLIGHPGDTPGAAGGGAFHDGIGAVGFLTGGMGGASIPRAMARTAFHQFRIGGGSGVTPILSLTATGGGLVRIQCRGAIVNAGLIAADAVSTTNGSGGGGGIVILASSTSIENSGTLSANGSNGNAARVDTVTFPTFVGAGGGGGGGIILLASPEIRSSGFMNVNGGLPGNHLVTTTQPRRLAGGGGGGSGGRGGGGGAISESGGTMTAQPAQAGDDGYRLWIWQDPIFLLH